MLRYAKGTHTLMRWCVMNVSGPALCYASMLQFSLGIGSGSCSRLVMSANSSCLEITGGMNV